MLSTGFRQTCLFEPVLESSDMNLPVPFRNRMVQHLGTESQAFFDALALTPPTSIRIHPGKFDHSLQLHPILWTRYGYYIKDRPVFTLDPLLHAGCYYVQEASSMLLESVMSRLKFTDSKPPVVLDLCAAPGGKSTHLLSLLPRDAVFVSNEVIRSRVTILAENLAKWSSENVIISCSDSASFGRMSETFDMILVDAPCSGEGLFRKDPEAISQWSPEILGLNAQRQRRILRDVLPSLRTGGYLVYCTCTFNPAENLDVVNWLVMECGFESIPIHVEQNWGFVQQHAQDCTGLQAYPHKVTGEGFFISLLQKTSDFPIDHVSSKPAKSRPRKQRSRGSQERGGLQLNKQELDRFCRVSSSDCHQMTESLQVETAPRSVLTRGHEIFFVNESAADFLLRSQTALNVISCGIHLGKLTRQGFVPHHELALSRLLRSGSMPIVEVDQKAALNYLRREAVEFNSQEGLSLVTYSGCPLGLVKRMGSRVNNWYPQAWRIRMKLPDATAWSILDEVKK